MRKKIENAIKETIANGGKIFLSSDFHFGDDFTRRDLNNEEQEKKIIENFKQVNKEDILICLGDLGKDYKKIFKIKGRKILILGNHDKQKKYEGFFIKGDKEEVFGKIILSHEPHPLRGNNMTNFHGHIHKGEIKEPQWINCSIDHRNYEPVDATDFFKKIIKEGN